MTQTRLSVAIAWLIALLALPAPGGAQKSAHKGSRRDAQAQDAQSPPESIFDASVEPGALNTFYGPGGKEHAPDLNDSFTFVKEDLNESQPKFDVEDAHGTRWKVKLGQEAKPEVAATRLVWAAGYFVDEDYYVDELKVRGLPKLHRGEKYASEDGTVHGARLERKLEGVKKLGKWSWFDNPFVGTREFNGLRVMMALLNNWDSSTINNSIYEVDGQRRYAVTDLGASFGKTGNSFTRSKGRLKDYVKSKFIDKTTAQYVDFVMHSHPFFPEVVDGAYYGRRSRIVKVAQHIPRADAKWLGRRLGQLSERQIRDCFRAAGYPPQEVDAYATAVQERIAQLNAL
ncbi:MAG TPA: hypothetical protein VI216_00575 [Candidatus Acidoferrales bacterium]